MRPRKSSSSASAAALPPWTFRLSRLVRHEAERRPASAVAASTPAGSGARRAGVALDRVGLQVEGVELLQPGVPVGREHAVRRAAAGQHLAALEDHVVLRGVQGDAAVGERAADAGVARQGVRVVVVVGVDRLHMELARQGDDLVAGLAVADDQADAVVAVAPAELGQVGVERLDAVADELDPPVGARQRIEDGAVEDEGAPDPARRLAARGTAPHGRRRAGRGETRPARCRATCPSPQYPKGRASRSALWRPARNKMASWRRSRST